MAPPEGGVKSRPGIRTVAGPAIGEVELQPDIRSPAHVLNGEHSGGACPVPGWPQRDATAHDRTLEPQAQQRSE